MQSMVANRHSQIIPMEVQGHEISPERDMCRQPSDAPWFHSTDSTQCYLAGTVNFSYPQWQCCWCASQDNPTGRTKSQGRVFGDFEGDKSILRFYFESLRACCPAKNAQPSAGALLSKVYPFLLWVSSGDSEVHTTDTLNAWKMKEWTMKVLKQTHQAEARPHRSTQGRLRRKGSESKRAFLAEEAEKGRVWGGLWSERRESWPEDNVGL